MKLFDNNIDGALMQGFIGCELLDDKELEKLRDSGLDSDGFIEKLTECIERWIRGGTDPVKQPGDIQTQVIIKSSIPLLKIDKGVVREFLDGKITADEFKDKLREAVEVKELPQGKVDVFILRLDEGKLELSGIPLDLDAAGGRDIDINLDLSDLGSMLREIEDALGGSQGDLDSIVEKYCDTGGDDESGNLLEKYTDEEWRELYEKEWKEQVDKWQKDFSPDGYGLKLQPFFGYEKDEYAIDINESEESVTVQIVVDDESALDEEGKIDVGELITGEDKEKLKSGDIAEEQFAEVLRGRLEERGYLEHDIHISIVADEYSITIYVKDGDVSFDFESKQ